MILLVIWDQVMSIHTQPIFLPCFGLLLTIEEHTLPGPKVNLKSKDLILLDVSVIIHACL